MYISFEDRICEYMSQYFRLQTNHSVHQAMISPGVGVLDERTVYVQAGRLPSGFAEYWKHLK